MPNAMVFGPDAKHFYLGCSIAGKVWRWDVSLDEENPQKILSNPRTVITIDKPAVPDGSKSRPPLTNCIC